MGDGVCVCVGEGHKQKIIAARLILIHDECANYYGINEWKQS